MGESQPCSLPLISANIGPDEHCEKCGYRARDHRYYPHGAPRERPSTGPVGPASVRISLCHTNAYVPARKTAGAAGYDVHSVERTHLLRGQIVKVPTGLRVAIPEGYVGRIVGRSSRTLAGLLVHEGTIDSDYRGEVSIIMESTGTGSTIEPGERIAQLVIIPCLTCPMEVVDDLDATERGEGGFGSTGA